MCLAIPGKVVRLDPENEALAVVDVSGVRRKVNVELVRPEGIGEGDWVLIHVGFALSKISAEEADLQLSLLAGLGEDQLALDEVKGYTFARAEEG